MAACANCGEDNPDRAKFCLDCGSPLTAAAPAPVIVSEEERKLDTLLFVDLVGSTALAESLDPEDVLSLLQLYYTRLRAELERFGGTVEKYIGDAIVTHFGVPVAHEDDPERAVRAALAVLEAVKRLNAEDPIRQIQVRIGVATGEVIVTLGARPEDGKGIAWGDILNTAARIESAAPVMGVLVGEETYKASAHAIEYAERDPIEAKGKSEPVRVWQALRVREAKARDLVRDAPLVGRQAEVERVLSLWGRVRQERRPALATLIGDPGIGKTRLLCELTDRVEAEGSVRWGRCLSYGEGITYWPVVEILEDAAGILKSDDATTVSAKLGALLEGLGIDDLDQLRTMAVALANLIGVPTTPRGTYSAEQVSQAELHWGIRRVFELQAAKRPLVLVFEDLHWAEPTLLDLIDFIAESEDAPLLVLASARRELESLRPALCSDGERNLGIALTALDERESEALLRGLLGGRELPPGSDAGELLRNASGNPLFLEETVGMLADGGFLDADGARGGSLEELRVPTSLQAMIGSRLDGLPSRDKRCAQHAAVMGMNFWSGAVAELCGPDADTEKSLDALEGRDFVRSKDDSTVADEREWAFKHALLRDVAYGRLPKGRRATLHVRFVDWVAAQTGGEDEFVEIVAYHLEKACKLAGEVGRSEVPPPVERAVDALMRAGEKAERREGIREADRFYARALELVGGSETAETLDLRLRRGSTLNLLGDVKRAEDLLSEVAEKAVPAGRRDLRARALIGRASIELKQARPADAKADLEEARAIAAETGDLNLQARAAFQTANLHSWFEADVDAATAELRRGLAVAEELDDRALRYDGYSRLGTLYYNVGALADAEEQMLQSSALVAVAGSIRDEARTTFQLALVKYHLGDIAEAERLALQAREWLERTGETIYQLQNLRTLGMCALARGDLACAEERLRDAIPRALELGGWLVVETYRCLIEVLLRQDRLADARDLEEFALRNLPERDVYARAAGALIQASIATAERRRTEAEGHFNAALALLEQQQLPLDLAEARVAYGRALHELGDPVGAEAALRKARSALWRMGARGLVAQIDMELGELAEGAGVTGPLASG